MMQFNWHRVLGGLFLVLAGLVWISQRYLPQSSPADFSLPSIDLLPIKVVPNIQATDEEKNSLTNQITAHSLYVMDVDSGATLLSKNEHIANYPASTVKLMTALVAMQVYDLDDILEVKREAFTVGHTTGLDFGLSFRVRDYLKSLLINSGNDAAFVLADNHPLGYEGFVLQMNSLAQELDLEETTFKNPSGLDAPGQTLTARDMAILAREVIKDPFLKEVAAMSEADITDVSGQNKYHLVSTNLLLGKKNVMGLKTGTTPLAGEALVTLVENQGREMIIVLLGSQDRFTDTELIIDWLNEHLVWQEIDQS